MILDIVGIHNYSKLLNNIKKFLLCLVVLPLNFETTSFDLLPHLLEQYGSIQDTVFVPALYPG